MTNTTAVEKNISICKLHYKKVRAHINLPALSEIFAQLNSPSILGGNSAKKDAGRFSYWVAEPKEIFEFRAGQNNPFEKLQYALGKYKLEKNSLNDLPKGIFCGGWVGYFSYEMGRYIEKLPATTLDDLQMPLIRLCFYDRVVVYDHIEENFWMIALHLPNDTEIPNEKLSALEQMLKESQDITVAPPAPADLEIIDFSQIKCNIDRDYYFRAVEKIKR